MIGNADNELPQTTELPRDTARRFYDQLAKAASSLRSAVDLTRKASSADAARRKAVYEEGLRKAEELFPSDSLPLEEMDPAFRGQLLREYPKVPALLRTIKTYRSMLQDFLRQMKE